MDNEKKKKILFVCTAFAPEQAVGSIRLTKMVKYLVRSGCDITVISPTLYPGTKLDQTLECAELKEIERIVVPQSPLFEKLFLARRNEMLTKKSALEYIQGSSKPSLKSALKATVYRLMQYSYTILRNTDWKNQVLSYCRAGFERNRFDIVFSSYPSLGAHWAAMALKERGIAAKWVADFRDPINYEANSTPVTFALNTAIQNRILDKADHVCFISNGMSTKFGKVEPRKFSLVPNGYDDDDAVPAAPPSARGAEPALTFCYVGSLYGGERDLSVLFRALKELLEAGTISAEKIRVIYAGKEFAVLHRQASPFGLTHILTDRGFISRADSLLLQQSSDLTIVASWNTEKDQGIISGKLFECFQTRKVVLGLVSGSKPASELAEIVANVNGGFVFEEASLSPEADYGRLVAFIVEKYREKEATGQVAGTYNENLGTYSYTGIAQRLRAIFA